MNGGKVIYCNKLLFVDRKQDRMISAWWKCATPHKLDNFQSHIVCFLWFQYAAGQCNVTCEHGGKLTSNITHEYKKSIKTKAPGGVNLYNQGN